MELNNIPNTSGIYLFFNRHKKVIYVGKSKNLKQRVASYFQENSQGNSRHHEMKKAIRDVKIKQTRNELEALLLEDEFIKKYHPEYNKKQKDYNSYCYLYITKDEFPTLKIVDSQEKVDASLFGPFEDRFKAQKVERLIYSIYKIRQCSDKTPKRKCINYSLNKCLGPCLGKIDANDYRKIINKVIVFLEGDCSKLLKYDHKKAIKSASDKMEYEKANILKNSEGFLKWFCKKMKFYHNFKTFTTVLSTKNLNFLFHKGQLVQKFSGSLDEEEIDFLTGEVIGNMDDRYILDRAKIIYNWLQNHNDSIRFL